MPAVKSTPADITLPPRNLEFVRGGGGASPWHADGSDASAIYGALSLIFPEGEKFFIESVKRFRDRADGKLADDIRDFISQEALHTREHLQFNQMLNLDPGLGRRIDELVTMRLDLARGRGPVAMLAVTVCLEHLTAIFADQIMRDPTLVGSPRSEISLLWQWHALEEAEHKGVAFDVFQRVGTKWSGAMRYHVRAINMVMATALFLWNWSTIALWLMERDGVTGVSARIRLYGAWFGRRGLLRRSLGGYLQWFRPGFHPWDHDNRLLIAEYRAKFAAAAPFEAAA